MIYIVTYENKPVVATPFEEKAKETQKTLIQSEEKLGKRPIVLITNIELA